MRKTHSLPSGLLTAAFVLASPSALALQVVEASDGVTVEGVLSVKEPTRIRIDGTPIVNVFGNLHSSNCTSAAPQPGAQQALQVNSAGEIVLECDADKGEIYVRPVGNSTKPVNLFVSSRHATYTLLLRRSDTPADTIVIRDKSVRPGAVEGAQGGGPARPPVHIRAVKALLVAMASGRTPGNVRIEEVHRPVRLWIEASFSLMRLYEGYGLVGEKYLLTNVSGQPMVLAEQEFDREDGHVVGVSIENHNLRPGESTSVYVIRQGG